MYESMNWKTGRDTKKEELFMTDLLYEKLLKHWDEVTEVPPQTMGIFTPFYKEITKRLKVMPWIILIPISLVVVFSIYVLLGSTVTFLVTLLQRGF